MRDIPDRAIGGTIKKLRQELGLTVYEMGQQFGIAYATIKNLEAGKVNGITLYMINRLAAGFKITPWELVEKILK